MWDERYASDKAVYGDAPNDFLREQLGALNHGPTLCLAEGQGRNALFLAAQGLDVTAMDQSQAGMDRAAEIARERALMLTTVVGDLADYDLGEGQWANIVAIFAHLPPALRRDVHARVVRALRPGGVFLLVAYTPDQLTTSGTGGPPDADWLMTLDGLSDELSGLEVTGEEVRRPVNEGQYHQGEGAVVQIIARKAA